MALFQGLKSLLDVGFGQVEVKWMHEKKLWMNGWIDRWFDAWMYRWVKRWLDYHSIYMYSYSLIIIIIIINFL